MRSDQPHAFDHAPAPAGAAAGHERYQMLDVWRGLVCLIVVLEHAGVALWSADAPGWGGWAHRGIVSALSWNFGSLLFFVMSGYCIASSLDASRRRGDQAGRFLYRRLWRIYPTYWAALLGFVAFVALVDALGLGVLHKNGVALELDSPAALDLSQWLGNLTLTETWRPLLAGNTYSSVYTRVAWSLCYQEQFYLVCVLALWLAPARLERSLAWATVAIVAFHLVRQDAGAEHTYRGTFPIYWHVFAVGLAVYWRLNLSGGADPRARRGVELALGALTCYQAVMSDVAGTAPYAFGFLLIALKRWDRAAGTSAWLAPVRACGRRSYSIYLAHLPVTVIGNYLLVDCGVESFWARVVVLLPVVTAASVAAGWAFHRAVESRFLGQPPKLGSRPGAPSGLPAPGATRRGAAAVAPAA